MSSFNKVILMGNLTRDPQIKTLQSNTTVAEFGIAMNRKFKTSQGEEREEVAFVDCTAFGKTGELIGQHFTKGKQIFLEGRLKYDSWEDKQGGGKRSKLSVVVENFQFVGSRGDGEQGDAPPPRQSPQGRPDPRQTAPAGGRSQRPATEAPFGDERNFQEADIPFAWSGRIGQPL